MFPAIQKHFAGRLGNAKLAAELFGSFRQLSERFVAQDPPGVLQHTGRFVEAALRVAEHLVLGTHTELNKHFNVDMCIAALEKAPGSVGLRIHVARLGRAIYDFRSRKNAVHLKDIDPVAIDAALIYQTAAWIMIELLKEGGVPSPEEAIKLLASRKIPLVQAVDGLVRTTNPALDGPQRLLVLLYVSPSGLTEQQLYEATRVKVRALRDIRTYLGRFEEKDLVHKNKDGTWVLFGRGPQLAEKIITENK